MSKHKTNRRYFVMRGMAMDRDGLLFTIGAMADTEGPFHFEVWREREPPPRHWDIRGRVFGPDDPEYQEQKKLGNVP